MPIVSTNARTKMIITTGAAFTVSAPAMSSCPAIGARLGGALTSADGSGVTPNANDSSVVSRMPAINAPGTCFTSRSAVVRKPMIASSVPALEMLPSATGAPGTPRVTTPT
ncbi:MAG: hypothetical protein U5K74_12030 [Gemmatimonadaceae bacterium]|nr:hypothetical protein [Gemmatimonadaceae bacterium]